MKKVKLSFVAILLLGAVACNKTNNSVSPGSAHITANVSNAEAADMVAGSLSLNSNGVANVAGDATLNATNMINTHAKCGTIHADTIYRQSTAGSAYSYSYNLTYNFTVNCNSSNQPDSLSSSLVYRGSFNGPNLSSTNSGSSIFTVGGLAPRINRFCYKRRIQT